MPVAPAFLRAGLDSTGESAQEQAGIRQRADIGLSISIEIGLAAIRRYQARGTPDMTAVVEPEVGRHARQDHDVSFLERVSPLVPAVQWV